VLRVPSSVRAWLGAARISSNEAFVLSDHTNVPFENLGQTPNTRLANDDARWAQEALGGCVSE